MEISSSCWNAAALRFVAPAFLSRPERALLFKLAGAKWKELRVSISKTQGFSLTSLAEA